MPTMTTEQPFPARDPYAVLRVPDFRWFVLSILGATLGSQIQTAVVMWQIYAVTRDPLALGLAGLAEALPFIGMALVAGHTADRLDRRRTAAWAQAALLACAAALTAMAGSITTRNLWAVYAVIVAGGVARSFLQISRTPLLTDILPLEMLPRAVPWRAGTWQFASVAGPAVGGVLLGWAGAEVAYGTAAALMGAALVCTLRIAAAPRPRPAESEPFLAALTSGVRFVLGHRVLFAAMTLDLLAVLFAGAEALLPVFAADIFREGADAYGILRAAPGVGAMTMSLLLAHRPPLRGAGRTLLNTVALFGLCMVAFGLSRSFWLSAGLLVLGGAFDTISVVIRQTLIQVMTPAHMQGRVSAVNAIFVGSSNELGAFESGVAAKLVGVVPSVVLGGAVSLLVVAATAWRAPALRRLDRIEAEPDHRKED